MTSYGRGYELLAWDSGIFGFPVARVQPIGDRVALTGALDAARRSNVRLVYLQTEDDEVARVAEGAGGVPISGRVTYVRNLSTRDIGNLPDAFPTVTVERWPGDSPTPELIQLAREAGRYSRFRIDGMVPVGVFERIYDAWIRNSVNGQIAEEVIVARDGASLAGLVTIGAKDGRAEIGLLSVSENARGQGLGRRLVHATLEWALRRKFREGQVITQQANVAACQLYESCGYRRERVERVFHFWL